MRRRTFLTNAARLAGGLAIAACTPAAPQGGPGSSPAATATTQPAAAVDRNLIIGSQTDITTGEPFHNGGGGTFGQVFNCLYDTVTRRDVKYKLEPGLATSWKLLNDTTWQFKLRPGVKFHNGDPLTSEDIKFSIEHTFDPAAKTIFRSSFATVDHIDIVDALTLNIIHKAPDPFMPDKLSIRPAYVVPKKYFESFGDPTGEAFGRKPVGTGPYTYDSSTSGVSYKLVKNPSYWRGEVEADSVTVLVRPDASSRIAALKTGEVNFIGSVDYDQIDELDAHPKTKVVAVPDTGQRMYIINAKVAPLDNKLIRQALSLSIDREGLNKTLYKGIGVIATGPVMPFEFGFDPSLPKLAYDPDRAKSLMQQAGYAGEEIAFEYGALAGTLLDQAIAEGWKKVGFNIKLTSMDAAERARKIQSLGFLGVTSATFRSFYADPDGVIWRTLQPRGSLRYWENAEFDRLGKEQSSSTDPELRLKNVRRMVEIMLDEMVWLSMWEEKQMWGIAKRIEWVPSFGVTDDFGPGHLKFSPA